jgi:hypothetical protein
MIEELEARTLPFEHRQEARGRVFSILEENITKLEELKDENNVADFTRMLNEVKGRMKIEE